MTTVGIKQVNALLERLLGVSLKQPVYWKNIKDDSRKVEKDDVFLALPSYSGKDGDYYIDKAVASGASFVIRDSYNDQVSCQKIHVANTQVECLNVPNLKKRHGDIISHFYGIPSSQITMVGVTGTNGKTSVVNLIAAGLEALSVKCGTIGTLGYGLRSKSLEKQPHTTPCSLTLQGIISRLVHDEAQVCAMEVSSHAIDQERVGGVHFDIGVLTNISHDHLDYHGSLAAYKKCKERLFYESPLQNIILNLDDELGERVFLKGHPVAKINAFTFKAHGKRQDVAYCTVTDQTLSGQVISIYFESEHHQLRSQLTGQYNAENLMSAFLTLHAMGYSSDKIVCALEQVSHIPGRFEVIHSKKGPTVIVDYAHTPDALKNVLITLQQVTQSKIWCVFGCGGDRDKEKRPSMGLIAEKYADHVVLTSDNPRSESPENIIDDIKSQMVAGWATYQKVDRVEAIRWTIKHADPQDVVLIAGKGHETMQVFSTRKVEHSDSDVVKRMLEGMEVDIRA